MTRGLRESHSLTYSLTHSLTHCHCPNPAACETWEETPRMPGEVPVMVPVPEISSVGREIYRTEQYLIKGVNRVLISFEM